MVISDICIKRPVFATVLSLLVLLVGLMSYSRLTVREYPNIDEPVVTVDTTYRGASAAIVESQVTKPLEDSLAGIEGVDVLSSISRQERSQITVRFRVERDADSAAADVRDRVSRVRRRLPDDVDEPVIAKVEADANPIIWVAFSSDRHSPLVMSDFASRVIKPRLQTLPGAADARLFGERRYSMRIWLDRDRLAAFGLTVQEVENAIRGQNVELPAGRIESSQREFAVVARTDLAQPDEFEAVVVRQPASAADYPVRIRDIGRVEVAPENERSSVRFMGRPAVSIGLIKQATANPLDLKRGLEEMLPRLESELPEGMSMMIANDTTVFIERSIDAVFSTIWEAVLLVAGVCLFFLRNWRAMLVPLVTIPVSLVGVFTLMFALGFSVNTLTLLALVLAIGLVVDDAIVVLENIYRHVEEGMEPVAAAFKGAKEIGFAVVAMTITLAAVYAPVAFMTGRTGKLFTEFALTLAGAVIVSGFVALTLSPMMCSRLLRHERKHGPVYNAVEGFLNWMTEGYRGVLSASLKVRWLVMLVFALVAGASVLLMGQLKTELAPLEDRGRVVGMFNGPEGATIDYMSRYAREIEDIYAGLPEVDRYLVITGNPTVSQGISFVGFEDWGARERSASQIAEELGPRLKAIPGVNAFPVMPASFGQSPRSRPVSFVVSTSDSYDELARHAEAILDAMRGNPGFVSPDTDLKLTLPELSVEVDRDRAADLGVPVDVIGRTLETMLGGRQVTRYKQDAEQYDVIVQVAAASRADPRDIRDIFVRARNGDMVPLANVVKVSEAVAPRELNHFGQRRSVTISANLAPDYALGEALQWMEETAARVLPPGYATDYDGQSREFKTSSASLALVFLLALAFIYLVLAAQFESFRDPFIIMLTVPLSMTGALGALWLTGGTLNVYSQIGLVTLVGLITKHGILIVEFANQLREQGRDLLEAVIEAAVLRLRPILMTTGAMVLGSVPLALATGAGAESRQQIGWVIVGGLLLGTFFTLFVVPTVYSLLARKERTPEVPAAGAAGAGI
ncbi:efflux RND transporter permease subunit [Thauera linaloolentis]|uniref:Acriflavin resistance protein n=1 Tax=Thauera linaloolentis (strain DSM 12138 / JCM 21573 / CCUG 41526 / CIP 105981 / IAM 15112 / NBRC 102519 / 47Lol) TaxID=1123367 RepID=N6Y1E7_THAL4|nr:efflux RND transporter permease subunit [Thauera linaloolentis]ENO87996.1 acriflavin resistance protein [Thauera linaloolentis 47Lol = DSM 12138]MCM8567067.1 efflux RND transporter permease subunit [Thauera linaloolentis]